MDLAVHSDRNWRNFVLGSQLVTVKVRDYYLGKGRSGEYTVVQRERVVRELFSDNVDVGSLVLPPPYKPDDFSFRANGSRVDVCLQKKPKIKPSSASFYFGLAQSHTMNHEEVHWLLARLTSCVN